MPVDAVICSNDDVKFGRISASLKNCAALQVDKIERISDAQSICEGYNRGAERCRAEWLLFCHDDIDIISINADALNDAFSKSEVFGVCGTERLISPNWYDSDPNLLRGSVLCPTGPGTEVEHQIFGPRFPSLQRVQALDGIFIACKHKVWNSIKFDDALPGYTGYDIDFTYRAHLNGYRVGVLTELILYHESTVGNFSSEKMTQWERNQTLLREKFRFRGVSDGYIKHSASKYDSLANFLECSTF